jgi:L-ascorbate metabolism protein UlaG (beta-lactamase superfamily)
MKKLAFLLTALMMAFGVSAPLAKASRVGQADVWQEFFAAPLGEKQAAFVFLGYSAVVVRSAKSAVIIDPGMILIEEDLESFRGKNVDAILFTHAHGDHFDLGIAAGLAKATGAYVVAEGEVLRALKSAGGILPSRIVDAGTMKPRTVGAWTVCPVRGTHVGPIVLYRLSEGEIDVFHGGDSGHVPLQNFAAGLAFLPAGDPSPTASPGDALKMARDLKASVVVAVHGSDAQYRELATRAKAALPATKVIIPETMKVYTVSLQ